MLGDENVFSNTGGDGDNVRNGIQAILQPGQIAATYATDVVDVIANGAQIIGQIPKKLSTKVEANTLGGNNPVTQVAAWAFNTTGIGDIVKVFDVVNGAIREVTHGNYIEGPVKLVKNIASVPISLLNVSGQPLITKGETKLVPGNTEMFYNEPLQSQSNNAQPPACYKFIAVYDEMPEESAIQQDLRATL